MKKIRFGVVGTGYMGKAHALALKSVATVFDTPLRPVCEMVCATTEAGAAEKARAFGFNRSTAHWRKLVDDPDIDAVVIASPQWTHRDIALAAMAHGKPVLCEKPLGENLDDSRAMVDAANAAQAANMVGFNYIRTPASQLARDIIEAGEIGRVINVQAEHSEDFLAGETTPADWRTQHLSAGTMGDLAPHIINAVLRLVGPVSSLVADIETVFPERPGPDGPQAVNNDDQANMLVRFENGATGSLAVSRVAAGRKMGYAYAITGTKGAIRFDQEDQNTLWLYTMDAPKGRQGFIKILAGPDHPDYLPFLQGPGHGTGYNEQITIEMRDFLKAIATGEAVWPTFRDGHEVNRIVEAARLSHGERRWVNLDEMP